MNFARFFSVSGTCHDINVMEKSTSIIKSACSTFPPSFTYTINKAVRNKPYWLANGIYSKAPIFVCTILLPQTQKKNVMI